MTSLRRTVGSDGDGSSSETQMRATTRSNRNYNAEMLEFGAQCGPTNIVEKTRTIQVSKDADMARTLLYSTVKQLYNDSGQCAISLHPNTILGYSYHCQYKSY